MICVLGMHRSGTSLTARLLNLLGMSLGHPLNLLPPAPDNPAGFWENGRIVQINEEILARLGGTWDEPPALPRGWADGPDLQDLRERAAAVLAEEFGEERFWGWKDPRTCLTLPFWTRLVPDARFVLCLRHPADVSLSLAARNGLMAERSLFLWRLYNLHALRGVGSADLLVAEFESYFRSPLAAVARLAAFVGVRAGPRALRAAARAVEPGLRHHRSDGAARAGGAPLPPAVARLYRRLRRQGCRAGALPRPQGRREALEEARGSEPG